MPRGTKGVSLRKSQIFDTRRYFVIASEGAETERIYFEGLQKSIIEQGILNKLIKIEFLKRSESTKSQSAHTNVIKQLNEYKKVYRLDERDELWLVIDRDKQNNPIKNISNISTVCIQKGYFMALSNPNFEFWLLLHLAHLEHYTEQQLNDFLHNKRANSSKSMLETELSTLLNGYNKSKYPVDRILISIENAIKQAKFLDKDPEARWIEDQLGSRVYRLVERILNPNA